ncbi:MULTISPECIES: hypothetical protein [Sphingobacterium]|uniref:hypothetical protein n=1 Tax=Sphingobacterium TaxID=28453 RepID=UPI0010489456|nr:MULTISPECIES: hypothetical protein [Sphingobacterium]MCW2262119.1 hypothetical protein [Sphingobacterium kitahiroshimense]NJI74958.1 hypothetical protein [Sphingobacterium sp. B16(2022)]TCR13134.1 hypothetical protein EDF67_102548 [Sphingobacterium sp. JUb78]
MKKIIKKISGAIQIILLAPVKLPAKVLNVLKYIGLGMGIIESVMVEDEEVASAAKNNSQARSSNGLLGGTEDDVAGAIKPPDRIVKYDLETGKEILDETE